jgi:CBS domain-containing protein
MITRKVRDVMTSNVVVATDATPFKDIVRRMSEHEVSALPIIGEDRRLLGIVSEGDLLPKEAADLDATRKRRLFGWRRSLTKKAAGLVASQLMTTPVAVVGPDASLRDAARLMQERKVKRLPVIDQDRRVIGIVSRADLLKVFLRPDAEIADEVDRVVLRRILWLEPETVRAMVRDGVVRLEGLVEQRSMVPLVIGLVKGVEGVVGVEDHLRYQVDDVAAHPSLPLTWGMMPSPTRRP